MNSIASVLLVLGGVAYLLLGALHALYTFLDIGHPRRIVPGDLGLIEVLEKETIRLAGTGTTFWRGSGPLSGCATWALVGANPGWRSLCTACGEVLVSHTDCWNGSGGGLLCGCLFRVLRDNAG
jgi:hypothetical protein